MFCRLLFVLLSFSFWQLALPVLRLMAYEYPFGIFRFLGNSNYITTFDQVMMSLYYEIDQVHNIYFLGISI